MNNTHSHSPHKKKSVGSLIVIIISSIVLVVALFNILQITNEYKQGQNLYGSLQSYTTIPQPTGDTLVLTDETAGAIQIDWNALHSVNPEIIAWVYIPGTQINYPVAQGKDNNYYLGYNVDGTQNSSGSIFMEMNNNPDFSDQNSVLYGHNMKDGSMFAGLHDYQDAVFFQSHPYIYIYTPGSEKRYNIFSAYETDAVSDSYMLTFADERDFMTYVQGAQKKSSLQTAVQVDENDKLLTLSTCVRDRRSKRYVVAGVLDQEKPMASSSSVDLPPS